MGEPDPRIRAIVGLGNPGARYERTRHNVGFLVVEELRGDVSWKRRAQREEAEVGWGGRSVRLVRPLTYMNRSGDAIARMVDELQVAPPEVLVVTDDVYLPWGRIRVRRAGGPGGHRGLESITRRLQTTAFPRVRVGVDAPPEHTALEEFVLAPLDGAEWTELQSIVTRAALVARVICDEGVGEAMNRFNASSGSDSAKGRAEMGRSENDG
jgi:PTH1 family peptidyl-tRNA hydrolase